MTTKAAETLDERAARVEAEAAEIRAEQEARHQQEARQLAAHQTAIAQATVDTYDKAALDQAVADARAELERAIETDPLTQAMAASLTAQIQRYDGWTALIQSLGQLGRPNTGGQAPPAASPVDIAALIGRAAERIAGDQLIAARDDRERRRMTPDRTKGDD